MKLKFNILILVFGLFYLSAEADEYTKEEHSAYLKSKIQALDITNKFGTITINDFGGDSVVVDVKITVENANEQKAAYLLDQIEIDTRQLGSLLKIETKINDDFKTKQSFTIDYTINIPEDRDLTVANKYGNVAVSKLDANGSFELSYGNINTGSMKAPDGKNINLEMAYGKADIETVNRMIVEVKYSKLFIGEAESLNIESKYSGLNVEEVGNLSLESKYDGVDIKKIDKLNAESKYTNYSIEELNKSLVLDTEYGSVRIDHVSPDFESIDLTNSYGGIDIGLGNINYAIDASCDYCDIKYPADKFQGNREKHDHSLNLKGNVGPETNKKVIIKSRYGGVKLKD